MLEKYDLRAMGNESSEKYHVLAEAMRRAFADRSEYLGDPDFVKVPVNQLIDKKYAMERAGTIDLNKASKSSDIKPGLPTGKEPTETTHFTVIDAQGTVVTNTYTINDLYGSAVTAKGTGVLLNDEMDDFAARPGFPNLFGLIQGENNSVQGGKASAFFDDSDDCFAKRRFIMVCSRRTRRSENSDSSFAVGNKYD